MSNNDLAKRLANLPPDKRMALFKQLQKQKEQAPAPMISRQSRSSNIFAPSFAQQRLWFLDRYEAGSSLYNMPQIFHIQGWINPEILQRVFDAIVTRHEPLRTTFASVEGAPVQVIAEHGTITLDIVDLRDWPTAEREALAFERATQDAQRPFDLAHGPLLRATLFQLDDTRSLLLLNMHHIVSDGWSIGVLIREIAALYQAFANGQPSPLTELPIQYVDFALWQRQWLQGDVLESQLSYWRSQLTNVPVLLMPLDRPRPAIRKHNGRLITALLPKQLATALEALAQSEGGTLFMSLFAAFNVLLHRYSGQLDIAVGTPIANRHRAEIEGLIGVFINMLVLRTDLSGNPTFRTLVQRVRDVALAAYDHQDLPFERLVEDLHPERDLSRTPLFQVMFILQNAPQAALKFAELTLEQQELDSRTSKFDLTLSLQTVEDGLHVTVEYNTDLFDASTIDRFVGHFQTLLEGIAANPDRPIADLPLLTPAEHRQLLVDWNSTETYYSEDARIHDLFVAQAFRTPQAVAVTFEDQQVTYAELNQRADQLANYLRRLGLGPDMLVGICVERSLEMIVGMLGILKVGSAYVPLDPTYPPDRLAFMLADAQVSVLVTQSPLVEVLPEHAAQVVCLDTDWERIVQVSATPAALSATPDNLAYVIYTSGSTGKPKGVQISHRAVINFLESMRERPGLTAQDTLLSVTTISFDIAGLEVFLPLITGARLVIVGRDVTTDGDRLIAALATSGTTVMQATPATWRLLIDAGWQGDPQLKVLCGGEALQNDLAQQLRGIVDCVWNMYGPTEATIWSAATQVGPEPVLIGEPISNTQLYVLDRQMRLVPVGVPGELYIGGDGLARGYRNRADLTADRFVPHPFSHEYAKHGGPQPAARLYRTGDLVRYLPNGLIEFLGRIDYQVKVRGFRIELGEVEVALGQHPAVQQVAVLVREDVPGDKRLVAYVVPNEQAITHDQLPGDREQSGGKQVESTALSSTELRTFAKDKLPAYMIPAAFVVLEAFPLTPNGKIDRQALPAPNNERADPERNFVAPRTPVEETLANLWADILNLKQVGVHDNFFDLGGHSLAATKLISRLRDAQAVEIPIRAIFEAPTIAELAQRVEAAQQDGGVRQLPPLVPVSRDRPLPLSFTQEWLMKFLIKQQRDRPLYITCETVRLAGPLDLVVLEQTFNEIVRRHAVFRTTFGNIDGQLVQMIGPVRNVPLRVLDLQDRPVVEREAAALYIAEVEERTAFDLSQDLLLRPTVVSLGQDDHALLLTMHQLICDGWSIDILIREVSTLYGAFLKGEPSPLPELPIQYADFAAWQRQHLEGDVIAAQLEYWKKQLSGCPTALHLPTDRSRPAVPTYRAQAEVIDFGKVLSKELKDLSRREGVTLFMTLLAAFNVLLSRYTGETDLVIGAPIANRNRGQTEGLIGFFANSSLLRLNVAGNPTFRALLHRARKVTLDASANQDIHFEEVMQAVQLDQLYKVKFGLLPGSLTSPLTDLQFPGVTTYPLNVDVGSARREFNLYIWEKEGLLEGMIVYSIDVFEMPTIVRMINDFRQLLELVVRNPNYVIDTVASSITSV